MMATDSVSIVFSRDELWLMRAYVRHEQSPPWQGLWPWYSLDLSDAIAEAIIFCEDEAQADAPLLLTRGDCLLLDAVIPQDAKTPAGVPVGRSVLLKAMRARQELAGAPIASALEPPALSKHEIKARLEARDADANPNHDADAGAHDQP